MRDVPDGLKDNVRTISGFGNFTVGVSNDNNFYIWGSTTDNLTNVNYAEIPDAIKDGNVLTAASGSDHIIAITTDGKIVGWGSGNNGQFGYVTNEDDPYIQMPVEFIEGTIDPESVDQLLCGYQVTGLVLDGHLYMWGNPNTMLSLTEFSTSEKFTSGVKKVAFSNYYAIAMFEDRIVDGGHKSITLLRCLLTCKAKGVAHLCVIIEP
jgi:alpha-tubulin suppressor-like RCC1 family protein